MNFLKAHIEYLLSFTCFTYVILFKLIEIQKGGAIIPILQTEMQAQKCNN